MFTLMVSTDFGLTYAPDQRAATVDELRLRMAELNGQRLRWCIEDEQGNEIETETCAIHKLIASTVVGG